MSPIFYFSKFAFSLDHHVSSVRHERGKRLWFNVSEMPVAEDVLGAELRIFQKDTNSPRRANIVYTVTVYDLINTNSGSALLVFLLLLR